LGAGRLRDGLALVVGSEIFRQVCGGSAEGGGQNLLFGRRCFCSGKCRVSAGGILITGEKVTK